MGLFEFAKVMMVLYNLLILVGGSGLIAVGFWMRLSGDVLGTNILGVFSIYAVNTVKVDIYFISVGIIMALLGFLGCCGAKKESKCLLIMFFSIIVVIFIAELTIGLFALAYSAYIGKFLRSWGKPALQDQYGRDFHFTSLWNMTMTKVNQGLIEEHLPL
ncbi:tetraspanin-1 [Ictalurus punctatus]|uniref:Tetraspanin-1 n=1 Tax=Ictalurus punctatus TaxID=7998 RepID=A0A9F7RAS7_ICTPU|nr:tetraspanin-1 [Ictalurus punctatus]XP_053539650.1 tetraspanin-1 [Ictalurus punctatus]